MRTGRPTPLVVLTAEERQTLEQWARRPTTAQGLAQRARLVLACASTKTNGEIAATAGVTRQTVGRWRHRFVRKRLQGLLDEPRPGAPRTITDVEVERVIALTLERTPRDATHWSTLAMAKRSGLSQTAVSRIWRAFGLQPHLGTIQGLNLRLLVGAQHQGAIRRIQVEADDTPHLLDEQRV